MMGFERMRWNISGWRTKTASAAAIRGIGIIGDVDAAKRAALPRRCSRRISGGDRSGSVR
jgi:hypothetical protein